MYKTFMVFFLTLCVVRAAGQMHLPDSGVQSPAADRAVATFQQAVQLQKEIYTGPEHISYLPAIEGSAYFLSPDWQPGAVLYDGLLYRDQLLKYDLVTDRLVLKRYDGFPIELRPDKISYFTLPEHTIVYWKSEKNSLKPGFYEQLAAGPLTILAKHTKALEERMENNQLRQRFLEGTAYYAIKDDKVHSVKSLGSVLDLVGDKRNAIQQHLKKKSIKFKRNREAALTAIAGFYNKP
jgi:hypothetical protein